MFPPPAAVIRSAEKSSNAELETCLVFVIPKALFVMTELGLRAIRDRSLVII